VVVPLINALLGSTLASGLLWAQPGMFENDLRNPDKTPQLDINHPLYDPNYDPATDAQHPLKSRDEDPGEKWQGHGRADGTPALRFSNNGWPWGEMFYGETYQTSLQIHNKCKSTQTAIVFVNVDHLTIATKHSVPGEKTLTVPATIKAPPAPKPPMVAPGQPQPPWGWVEPPKFTPGFGEKAVQFHQPHFTDVKGNVVVWHPWDAAGKCPPKRHVYKVSGHFHFKPGSDEEEKDAGPSTLATADPCEVYWRTGLPPANLKEDCTGKMRRLAAEYLQRHVGPYRDRSKKAWSWLGGVGDVSKMSIDELLSLKAKADAQMLQGG